MVFFKCHKVVFLVCTELEQIQDGTLKFEQHSETIDYMEGTSVTLECNTGYGLQGNAEATCTNGEWTATLGTCIQCKQLLPLTVALITTHYVKNKNNS